MPHPGNCESIVMCLHFVVQICTCIPSLSLSNQPMIGLSAYRTIRKGFATLLPVSHIFLAGERGTHDHINLCIIATYSTYQLFSLLRLLPLVVVLAVTEKEVGIEATHEGCW